MPCTGPLGPVGPPSRMVLRSNTYWWTPGGLIPCGVVGESVGAPGAMGYPGERTRLVFERAAEVLRVRECPSEEESHPERVGVHTISPETTDLTIERGPSQDSGSLRGLQRSFSSMGIGVSPQGKLKARSWCTSFSGEFSNSSLIPVGRPKETKDQNHHEPAGEHPSFRKTPSLMRHHPVFPLTKLNRRRASIKTPRRLQIPVLEKPSCLSCG